MRVTIPTASANRLRQAYAQVEQLSALIAEAMGLDPLAVTGVDIPGGAFLLADPAVISEHTNGVAVEA